MSRSDSDRPGKSRRCEIVGQRPAVGIHSFKNRVHEVPEIRMLLDDSAVRVISLLGRRGIGKSLLAVRVATSAAEGQWPDGSVSESLDAVVYLGQRTSGITFERAFFDCLSLLPDADADRMRRVWAGGRTSGAKASALFDALRPRDMLVVFDNMEDVLDAQGRPLEADLNSFIEALITHEQAPRLLITSQIPLNLDPPYEGAQRSVVLHNGLPDRDAVTLMRELDPYGRSGIREADEELLAQTARQVYGVPRGLELIVGALRDDLSMRTLREWLADRDAVTNVVDQLAQRHYQALDDQQRLVMDILAAFGTPVTLAAIEWALRPLAPTLNVHAEIRHLISSYLIRQDRRERTYALHPMDADIALNSMRQSDADLLRQLHRRSADWYGQSLKPPEEWLDPTDVLADRKMIEHRIKAEDYDEAAIGLGHISEFLLWQGSVATVTTLFSALEGKLTGSEARLAHLIAGGHAYFLSGPLNHSYMLLEQAETLAALPRHEAELQRVLFLLGDLDRFERRPSAVARLRRAADLAAGLGMVDEQAHSLLCLSLSLSYAGEPDAALLVAEDIAALAASSGLPLIRARLGDALACAYITKHEWDMAARAIEDAIAAYRETGIPEALGFAYNVLGLARCGVGDFDAALTAFEEGIVLAADAEMARPEAMCFFNRAWAQRQCGSLDAALESVRAAQASFHRHGAADERAALSLGSALAAELDGRLQEAAMHLEACAARLEGNSDLCVPGWLMEAARSLRLDPGEAVPTTT